MKFRDVARLTVLVLVVVVWTLPTAQGFELTGEWDFVFDTENGSRQTPVVLHLEGDQVSGKFNKSDVKGTFQSGKLDLKFPFYSEEAGFEDDLNIIGGIEGETLKGDWTFGEHAGTWIAKKK